jgi:hypothetical protein
MGGQRWARVPIRRVIAGIAATTISREPTTMDITMPGTFFRPKAEPERDETHESGG